MKFALKQIDMNYKSSLSLIIGLFILASCATYAPFTEPMLKEFKLDTKNIKNVQFYLSAEIVMYKLEDGHPVGKEGSVFVKNEGGVTQKIRVRAKTPCVVERIDKEGFFYVRFEEGPHKTLKFRKAENNRYYLHTDYINNRHQLEYANELYYVTNPSLVSFVMVQIRNTKGSTNERVIARGKRA